MALISERNGSRYEYSPWADDGYDFMATYRAAEGWAPLAGWGRDGWDLGDWPYVIVFVKQTEGNYGLTVYVEGDLHIRHWTTREERDEAINQTAFFYWRNRSETWIKDIPVGAEPDHLKGRYR